MAISVILVIMACVWISDHRRQRAEQELREKLNGLKLQYAPAERDTIRDSVKVITQQVLQMPAEEYKLQAYDRQLLHDLDIRLGQVMVDQRTSLSSADTVKTDRSDSVYTYCDRWLSFRLNTADSILTYKARDSLQTIVYRQYKHRFLWWRWGEAMMSRSSTSIPIQTYYITAIYKSTDNGKTRGIYNSHQAQL